MVIILKSLKLYNMKLFSLVIILLISIKLISQDSLTYPVYFDVKSSVVDTSEMKILKQLFRNLDSFQVIDIKISAYCDERGGKKVNDILSKKRANAVFNFIREGQLVDSAVISQIEGKGYIKLVSEENVDEQRRVNRRSELVITYKKKAKKETKQSIQKNSLASVFQNTPKVIKKEDAIVEETMLTKFLSEAKVGEKLDLNIFFYGGTHRLFLSSKSVLKELLILLKTNSKKINIQGHVCCIKAGETDGLDIETKTTNLSYTRAKSVFDYLVQNGIESNRLKFEGLGGKFPTGKGENQDRRVEIVVLSE